MRWKPAAPSAEMTIIKAEGGRESDVEIIAKSDYLGLDREQCSQGNGGSYSLSGENYRDKLKGYR